MFPSTTSRRLAHRACSQWAAKQIRKWQTLPSPTASSAGTYPVWSTGGGTGNCAYYDKPLTTFTACFSPQPFTNNAVIASPSAFPPSLWPSGNFFPTTTSAVQFVNFNNGNGGNYQLMSTSPYRGSGTDGKDLGADVATIQSETAGVY